MSTQTRSQIAHSVITSFMNALTDKQPVRIPSGYDTDDAALFRHSYSELKRLHDAGIYKDTKVAYEAGANSVPMGDVASAIAYISLQTWARRRDGESKVPASLYKALAPHIAVLQVGTPTIAKPTATPVQANAAATIQAAVTNGAPASKAQAPLGKGLTWEAAKAAHIPYMQWQHSNNIPTGTKLADSIALFTKANAKAYIAANPPIIGELVEPVATKPVAVAGTLVSQGAPSKSTAVANMPTGSVDLSSRIATALAACVPLMAQAIVQAIAAPTVSAQAPTPATIATPTQAVRPQLTPAERKARDNAANRKSRAKALATAREEGRREALEMLAGMELAAQPVVVKPLTLQERIDAAAASGTLLDTLKALRTEGHSMAELQAAASLA